MKNLKWTTNTLKKKEFSINQAWQGTGNPSTGEVEAEESGVQG